MLIGPKGSTISDQEKIKGRGRQCAKNIYRRDTWMVDTFEEDSYEEDL